LILLFVLSHVSRLTGIHYLAQTLVEMRSHKVFAQTGLEMILPMCTSQGL
jgi:hypothetical protein